MSYENGTMEYEKNHTYDEAEKEIREEQARKILYQYYNLLMDDYNGNASEEALEELLEEIYGRKE